MYRSSPRSHAAYTTGLPHPLAVPLGSLRFTPSLVASKRAVESPELGRGLVRQRGMEARMNRRGGIDARVEARRDAGVIGGVELGPFHAHFDCNLGRESGEVLVCPERLGRAPFDRRRDRYRGGRRELPRRFRTACPSAPRFRLRISSVSVHWFPPGVSHASCNIDQRHLPLPLVLAR